MEILDICDELGNPTGKTVERKIAHQQGILHRTAHVWILRKKENKIQILLQKRSEQKDSFPGCYDISSAGHIPAGDNYGQSAVRELKEELGIVVRESELIDCGNRRFHFEEIFHGRLFKDNQVIIDDDIIKNTNEGKETVVKLGETIGKKYSREVK